MEAFPAFYPLAGRRVVIAGHGEGAEAKARLLAGGPATVMRLTDAEAERPDAYAGAVLAFVAAPDDRFCAAAAAAARQAGVPVNVVDHPELSDFHTPAIIDRGQVVAAIGTGGAAPILAALLRAELEAKIPAGLGPLAAALGRLRSRLRVAFPDLAHRRAFLRAVLEGPAGRAGDEAEIERLVGAAMDGGVAAAGRVWLITEPAAPDLLTLRAARALSIADVLVLGDTVAPGVTALARRDASFRRLAETDGAALKEEAARGRQVVVAAVAAEIGTLAQTLAALGAPVDVVP